MQYTPRPLDTARIELPPGVERIVEEVARHTHDVWARGRISAGWTWGPARDDAAKQTPALVPFEELSEEEKEYDRRTALESVKAVLSHGYVLQRAAPPGAAPDARAAEVPAKADDQPEDVVAMLEQWRSRDRSLWARRPDLFRGLAAYLRGAGEALVAYDVVTEGLTLWPHDLRLRQLQALTLADLDCAEDARAVAEPLRGEHHPDESSLEETLGILGRVYKDLARHSRSPSAERRWLRKAYDEYSSAYRKTGGYWTGINAASLAVVLGQRKTAEELAGSVRAKCLSAIERDLPEVERYWPYATLGEAALIAGRPEEACEWYRKAMAAAPRAYRWIASSRRNARLLAECLELDWSPVDATLALPPVVVFAGSVGSGALPSALEAAVRDAIGARLDAIGPAICYSSAAGGEDILFLEAALARRNEAVVVLPCPPASLHGESAGGVADGDWGMRFAALLPRVHLLPPITAGRVDTEGVYHRFTSEVLVGLARHRAETMGTALRGLALSDGGPAPHRLGLRWEHIDLADIRRRAGASRLRGRRRARNTSRTRGPAPATRALLFADVKDFSKMPEESVRPFVRHVFGLVGALARKRSMAPLARETRGDGVYLVFPSVAAAGRFALALAERVRRTDWTRYRLPAGLIMRIAVHAGPVLRTRHPVSGRTVYVGTHVNRVARIEPVTPPGQVYASQEFAALAALEAVPDFACDYVGQVPLAKEYGTFPMYHLRRRP